MDRTPWPSRIVRHARMRVADLAPHPHNPRTHPERQRLALEANIRDLGFIRSVTWNERTGHVLDGHLRLELAKASGQEEIDVEVVDLSEAEEAQALVTMDPMAAMAQVDAGYLDVILRDFQTSEAAVQQLLDDEAKRAGLYRDEQEEPAETTETQAPQVWIVQVACTSQEQHDDLIVWLGEEGYTCHSLVT